MLKPRSTEASPGDWKTCSNIWIPPQTNQNQNFCRGNLALILKTRQKQNNNNNKTLPPAGSDILIIRLVNHYLRNSEDTSQFGSASVGQL